MKKYFICCAILCLALFTISCQKDELDKEFIAVYSQDFLDKNVDKELSVEAGKRKIVDVSVDVLNGYGISSSSLTDAFYFQGEGSAFTAILTVSEADMLRSDNRIELVSVYDDYNGGIAE
ncbi:hypothetical protein [Sphingobacterium hungaricum]|uniref:DUF4136 domain-containing protein n=1 Tax=Sphingobacterium hungaricum TaxID=2082723 RepID=A0A928YPV7_9SPHI|nr:hypothetical protein [Sphingobacterium hungaricum]MBE8713576.1 hypothetical protein [Sphingobacterium hungaricum]